MKMKKSRMTIRKRRLVVSATTAVIVSIFMLVDYVEAFSITEMSHARKARLRIQKRHNTYNTYNRVLIATTTSTANLNSMREFQLLASNSDKDDVKASSSAENNNNQIQLNLGGIGSLELLAIATSLFFVLLVSVFGDSLFAAPTYTPEDQMTTVNGRKQRAIINADEVLKTDFTRIDTSVEFY